MSIEYASRKYRRAVAAATRPIYTAPSETAAEGALEEFAIGPSLGRY